MKCLLNYLSFEKCAQLHAPQKLTQLHRAALAAGLLAPTMAGAQAEPQQQAGPDRIPIAVPQVDESEVPSIEAGPRDVVIFDLQTGQERKYDTNFVQLWESEWLPGSLGSPDFADWVAEEPLGGTSDMNSLSEVTDTTTYPARTNVKLWLTFNGVGYEGSGTLIDSYHVLTAGHCVYDSSLGGLVDSVEVIPGYDDGYEPFGASNGVSVLTWDAWRNDTNWRYDVAVIRLDKPIGAVTGWLGYGYSSSCSSYKSKTHHNFSYPGEGGYDGLSMYYRYGDFDSCPNSDESRHLDESWGGQSGSGYYRINSSTGNRYVYSVLSHGHGDSKTDGIRLTNGKFESVQAWINAYRPDTFDLLPTDLNLERTSGDQGDSLGSFDFLIHNYGDTTFDDNIAYSIRISTNSTITTSDLLYSYVVEYGSGTEIQARDSIRRVHASDIIIPSTLSAGTYYLGVILDVPDANSGNNDSSGVEAVRFTVY